MNELLHWAVIAGTGVAVAAYCSIQAQDDAWDGAAQTTVELASASLNETGLTDEWTADDYAALEF